MTTTKQQLENLLVELLKYQQYSVTKTATGISITKNGNTFSIASGNNGVTNFIRSR